MQRSDAHFVRVRYKAELCLRWRDAFHIPWLLISSVCYTENKEAKQWF